MSQRARKGYQDWNTPLEVLAPLRDFLPITLDPCSNATSIVNAAVEIRPPQNGLDIPWYRYGHTFINMPYSDQPDWLAKAESEYLEYDAGTITALIPASTETAAFRLYVFGSATAIAFWKRRIPFDRADGHGTGNSLPSALVYWGNEIERFAAHFARYATVVTEWTK